MNIYQKLQEARCRFQDAEIKKTGHNKFSDYDYFELGDFMPTINCIMRDLGMAAITSFGTEIATMTIVNSDQPEERIEITSPMSKASLKACHEVQNLGAVETYIRRYLWQAALEIVEHDTLDGVTGKPDDAKKPNGANKPPQSNTSAGRSPAAANDLIGLYELAASKGFTKDVVMTQAKKRYGVMPRDMSETQYRELRAGYLALPDKQKDKAS